MSCISNYSLLRIFIVSLTEYRIFIVSLTLYKRGVAR